MIRSTGITTVPPASLSRQSKKKEAAREAASSTDVPSAIVGVAPGRGRHRRIDRDLKARQNPRPLARGKARSQQAVIDLPRHGEAVENGGWEVQA